MGACAKASAWQQEGGMAWYGLPHRIFQTYLVTHCGNTWRIARILQWIITKASLLAGVCFPLGMYWGQSFWCRSDLSHRNVPFKWFNHLILTPPPWPPPPPLGGFNSRWVHGPVRWVHGPVSCFELLFLWHCMTEWSGRSCGEQVVTSGD